MTNKSKSVVFNALCRAVQTATRARDYAENAAREAREALACAQKALDEFMAETTGEKRSPEE